MEMEMKIGNLIDDAIDTLINTGVAELSVTHGELEINIKQDPSSYIVTVNGISYVSRGYGWEQNR